MKKSDDKRAFAITSVAENEGKSTIAVNTAIALSNRGYKVALLDLDVHKPSIYKIFDFYYDIKTDFAQALKNKEDLNNFEFFSSKKSDLLVAFTKTAYEDSTDIFKGDEFKNFLAALREKTDFVIIDTPPVSVSADAYTVASMTDGSLLVIRVDCVPVRDINDAVLVINDTGGALAGCILNNVYKPFTLMGQMGTDETGRAGYGSYYYGYSKYGKAAISGGNSDERFSANYNDKINREE